MGISEKAENVAIMLPSHFFLKDDYEKSVVSYSVLHPVEKNYFTS